MRFWILLSVLAAVSAKVHFEDTFSDGDKWTERWTQSTHHKEKGGKFILSAGKFYGDAEQDKGLQTSEDARFYAISAKFDKPVSTADKKLVLQMTVKHEQDIDCGGGYLKLFGSDLDQTDMHGDSEYKFMFGPDICGPSTKKVHVIFNHKGKNHLITKDIRCKDDVFTHLYTLIVDAPAGTLTVLIDNEEVHSGPITESHDALPPPKIKDPDAKKPADWDDRKTIPDETDVKPEDWDKPEYIPDPEATKPDDWDDEMDGEWEAPMIDNPEHKGQWKPKEVDNPNYSGVWVHPEIDNPDYDAAEVETLCKYSDIQFVGIDLWQVKSGTIFDNILVTDDVDEAKAHAEKYWAATVEPEKLMKKEQDEQQAKLEEAEMAKNDIDDDANDEDEDFEPEDDDEEEEDMSDEDHDEL